MKYIISENRLNSFIETWLNSEYGNLEKYNRTEFKEIFLFKNGMSKFMFNQRGKQLYVLNEIYDFLKTMFGLDHEEIEEILIKWSNKTYGFRAKRVYRVNEI